MPLIVLETASVATESNESVRVPLITSAGGAPPLMRG
jgi:hypothetical protein